MIYFTSDLHLGHENVIRLCHRPFGSIEEMNETLIKNWNSKVKPTDTVYILGDITFKMPVLEANKIIKRLNGKKHLIKGNHDKVYDENLFESVSYYKELKYNGLFFCLMHYPLAEWNHYFRGSIHLHGHQHNSSIYNTTQKNNNLRKYDVGVDANNFYPISIDEILEYFNIDCKPNGK